jgi:hypothetical protein
MKISSVAVAVFVAFAVAVSVGSVAGAADKYLQRVDENGKVISSAKVAKAKKSSSKVKKSAKGKAASKVATKSAAQKAAKISAKPKQEAPAKNMSRDVVFDGSTVNGRYHSAGEAVATVENEKKLNDLIGARKDFKDRLAVENARLKKDGVR